MMVVKRSRRSGWGITKGVWYEPPATNLGSNVSRPMDVTIVDGDAPYPANSGKRLRSLNLVLPLAQTHRITYIARCNSKDEADTAAAFLSSKGIEPIMVVAPIAAKSGAAFYGRLAGNLLSSMPYTAQSHVSAAMREAVVAHAARARVDVWQVEWFGYLYCVKGLAGHKVLVAHNIESLIWERYAATESNALKRVYVREQWRKMLAIEGRAFRSVDKVVAVSEPDIALGRKLFGNAPFASVDNGVDVAHFREVRPETGSRQVLFLGALDWRPNLDAIDLLLEEIFPAVRARVKDARLAIVGRSPPPRLVERAGAMPGVTIHANVPDVRPFMAASAMMAVPLRIGGGSRLKIIEALAARLPVVSTTIGAEGLELEPERDFDLADTPAGMAEAIVARLEGPRRVEEATWAKVAARYDWPILAQRLDQVWREAVAAAGAARSA